MSGQADDQGTNFSKSENALKIRSQLNGNNGSWTNGDDMSEEKKGKKKEERKLAKVERVKQLNKQKAYIESKMKKPKSRAALQQLGITKVIRGRGDYSAGRNIGSKVGGWIGEKLHGWLSGILGGGGDYTIAQGGAMPAANSLVAGSSVPSMHNESAGSTRISFHEFIGNIDMTSEFSCRSFNIDISDPNTFPWLSVMAKGYQKYKITGCVFFLRTLSSDVTIAPTQGMGSVFGSVRYDVHSSPPTSKQEVLNSMFASSAKPSMNQAFPIECAQNLTSMLKVRQSGVTPVDEQFYSAGIVDVCTEGAANGYPDALEMHVAYDIVIDTPRLDNGGFSPTFMMDCTPANVSDVLKPSPDTFAVKQPRLNTIGCAVDATTYQTVIFPLTIQVGSVWMFQWLISGGLFADLAYYTPIHSGGMGVVPSFGGQTVSAVRAPSSDPNTGGGACMLTFTAMYYGGGTTLVPPRLGILRSGGNNFPDPVTPATCIITGMNPIISSGLTLTPPKMYKRSEFFRFICDHASGIRSRVTPPPGEYRLVDWVHQFTKNSEWPADKKVPRCPAAFDITLVDAVSTLARYVGELGPTGEGVDAKVEWVPPRTTDIEDCVAPAKADSDGEYEVVTTRIPRRNKKTACARLNGNNGSATNTDDVSGNQVVIVNPCGLSGNLSSVYAVMTNRANAGWKYPQYSMVKTSVDNVWLWLQPPKVLSRTVNKLDPVGVWTINKVRKVQCYAIKGLECTHEENDCPARVEVGADDPEVRPQLNGNNGSVTNTDDIRDCRDAGCNKATHRHFFRKKAEGPAQPGAAQRIAQRKKKEGDVKTESRVCVTNGQHTPLVNGVCRSHPGVTHHHGADPFERHLDPAHAPDPGEAVQDYMDEHKTDASCQTLRPILNRLTNSGRYDDDEYDAFSFTSSSNPRDMGAIPPHEAVPTAANSAPPIIVPSDGDEAKHNPIPERYLHSAIPAENFANPEFVRARRAAVAVEKSLRGARPGQPGDEERAKGRVPPRVERVRARVQGQASPRTPHPPDDPDPNPSGPEPAPRQPVPPPPAEEVKETKEDKIAKYLQNLYNKAVTQWMIRDPTQQVNQQVVLRALTAIVRKDDIYLNIPHIETVLAQINNQAQAAAMAARIEAANSRGLIRRKQSSILRIWHWFKQPWASNWYDDDCTEMETKEGVRPFSRVELTSGETAVIMVLGFSVLVAGWWLSKKAIDKGFDMYSEVKQRRPVKVVVQSHGFFSSIWSRYKTMPMNVDLPREVDYVHFKSFEAPIAAPYKRLPLLDTVLMDYDCYVKAPVGVVKRVNQLIVSMCKKAVFSSFPKIPFYSQSNYTCSVLRPDILYDPLHSFRRQSPMRILKTFGYVAVLGPFCEEVVKRIVPTAILTIWPELKGTKLEPIIGFVSGAYFGMWESAMHARQRYAAYLMDTIGSNKGWETVFSTEPEKYKKFLEPEPLQAVRAVVHGKWASLGFMRGWMFHGGWNGLMFAKAAYEDQWVAFEYKWIGLAPSMVIPAIALVALSVAAIYKFGIPYRSFELGQKVIEDVCLDEYKIKPAVTQKKFRVKYGEAHCVPGHGATGSWGVAGYVGTTFRSCHHNELISLCGRVGKALPAHVDVERTAAIHTKWVSTAHEFMLTLDELKIPFQYQPMNYEKWCATFPPARRDLLLAIAANVEDMPALKAKSFIKKEIAVKDEVDPIFKDPRWIQGCPPELSARVGPYLRKWVHKFRDAVAPDWTSGGMKKGKQIVYTCGLNAQQIGQALADSIEYITSTLEAGERVVFMEDDQSRFDLHLLSGPFHALNRVYRKYLPRKVAALLVRSVSRGTSSLGTKYSIPYTMQSGWPDTSIGDSLVNAAMKFSIHGVGRRWISIICGDDSVTITVDSELSALGGLKAITDRYADFGMEIEACLRFDVLDVEFCSGRFYPCGETFVLMPRIGRLLSKIGWDPIARSTNDRIAWLRSIGQTLREYGRIDPLLLALGNMIRQRLGEGRVLDTRDQYKYYVSGDEYTPPSDFDVAVYYDHHYQLSTSDVREIAAAISASTIGSFVCDPRLVDMVAHDG